MTTTLAIDVVLPNGVVLDASIFDDRNYAEVDDLWLARAQVELSNRRPAQEPTPNLAIARN